VEPLRSRYTESFSAAAQVQQRHCSAYAYLDTARGQSDFVMQYLMSPWDHAAGALIVEEAGGAVRFLDDGSPYTPERRGPRPMLAVGDAEMWADYAGRLIQ
jgi:fructose-1,6-bisphosphatase/inositol monophosphatase family enzyme